MPKNQTAPSAALKSAAIKMTSRPAEVEPSRRFLPERLRSTMRWTAFEAWVAANDRPLSSEAEVEAILRDAQFWQPFLAYETAIVAANARRILGGRDSDWVQEKQNEVAAHFYAAGKAYGLICAADGGTLSGLKDHICKKVGPRAKHDVLTRDRHGITFAPATLTCVSAEGEPGEDGDLGEPLDLLGLASPAWTDGHRSVQDEWELSEDRAALFALMARVLEAQRKRACRTSEGARAWKALMLHGMVQAEGSARGELQAICDQFGVVRSQVEDLRWNLSRNLVSALARSGLECGHLISAKTRARVRRAS